MEDLNLVKKINNKRFIAQSYLNLGRIFFRFKDYEKSKNYLLKATEFFEKSGFLLNLFETYLFLILNPTNNEYELEMLKNKIKSLIDNKGYTFYIKSVLTSNEEENFKIIFEMKKEKRFIIKTFGKFIFYKDGVEIKNNEWKRESVKDLFKYLIIKKGRALKDEIYEDLFPNLSLSSKYNSLRVSISILKRILEPDLNKYEKSRYIKIERDLIYINFDEFYIDSYVFENISKIAIKERNPDLISKSMEIYKDRFLNEDRYKDFVIHKTLELEEIYINLLNLYGELSINSKNNKEKGFECLRKSLQIDPFQDEILKKYFDFLIKSKKKALAIKIYKEFKEKYKKNWDIDISKIINIDKIL
jgi:LuxR family maltose regulon positive regulatory protein